MIAKHASHTRPFFARNTLQAALSVGALAILGLAGAGGAALAEEGGGKSTQPAEVRLTPDTEQKVVRVIGQDGKEVIPPPANSDVERYCTAIADPARDARAAIQEKRLKELEAEVDGKIDALEAKRLEYQDWLEQRRAFIDSTSSIMQDIYAKMKPDAAASQLAGIDRRTAAAILAKLKPRSAGAILSEMPAKAAAEIGNMIAQKTNKSMDSAQAAALPGQG